MVASQVKRVFLLLIIIPTSLYFSSSPAYATANSVKIALTVDTEYDRGIILDNPIIYGPDFWTKLESSWTALCGFLTGRGQK